MLQLGKRPPRPGAVKFKLANYVDLSKLPAPPKSFGHDRLIPADQWGMLGNQAVGDCVLAAAAHDSMLWNAEAGRTVPFDDHAVISDYSAITGYDPADPYTDEGTDMQVAASYRRKTGITDAHGKRHKIAAYLAIKPGDINELYQALYLFGAVDIGIQFPSYAMELFNAGKPWTYRSRHSIVGGHAVSGVARRNGQLVVVTWGRAVRMSAAFFTNFCDEAIVAISQEALTNGKSPEGFDLAALQADLAALPAA
jgi:hypothetical protein